MAAVATGFVAQLLLIGYHGNALVRPAAWIGVAVAVWYLTGRIQAGTESRR